MFVSCISAYFCGFTHLKIWFYLLMYQYGTKKPRKQIYLPQLASQSIWPRPKLPKGAFHLLRSWITKQREDSPSTGKKRTINRPFYLNPIFIAISSFPGLISDSVLVNIPRAMDEKIRFQTKEQWRKYHCGSRVYNLSGPPWGKKERKCPLWMRTQKRLFFSIGCNRSLE